MGETAPVVGIHTDDQQTDIDTAEKTVSVLYNPEDPNDALIQGDCLQQQGPSLNGPTAGPGLD